MGESVNSGAFAAVREDGSVVTWGDGINEGIVATDLLFISDIGNNINASTPPDALTYTLSISATNTSEGNSGEKNMVFTLTLDKASTQDVIADYYINSQQSTAMIGEDYKSVYGTVTIAKGQTSATVNVPIIGDTKFEDDESVSLVISNVKAAKLANNATTITTTGIIKNDDASVSTDKLFLKDNTPSTLTQTGKVFGSSGSNDSLIIKSTALGSSVNANVEQIQFEGAIADYEFSIQGTQLWVYLGNSLLANIGIQADANGTAISFSDLSTTATLAGLNQAKLGKATVPTTKSGLSKTEVQATDTTKPKFTWKTNAGSDGLGLKVNSNEDGFATLFAIDGTKMTQTAYGVNLSANVDAIVTVAAQSTLTKTALFVFDKANNYLADSYFWLGTTGADTMTAINNYDAMFGFGGGDRFTLKSEFTGQINSIVGFQATASNNDSIAFGGTAKAWTTAPSGWTITNGVAKKNGATVNDFLGAFVGATGVAGAVVAFEYSGNTYVFGEGASTSDSDNTAVILDGVTGITTVGTMAGANTIVIA